MKKEFFARGKLLLSGEYAVLNGALALSLPCKYGQSLKLYPHSKKEIHWKSFDEKQKIWFEAKFDLNLNVLEYSSLSLAENLQFLLKTAFHLSGKKIDALKIESYLDFNREWGLGSSSTLLSLISQWQQIDAMEYFFLVANGSGYDVAAATCNYPILYQLKKSKANWQEVEIPFEAFESSFFIHLNKKQKSDLEVEKYKLKNSITKEQITGIDKLSLAVKKLKTDQELQHWIKNHENLMANILGKKRIKEEYFPDFKGEIKSLGAWGGDFILASGSELKSYFLSKNFKQIIPFKEMIHFAK